MVLFILLRFSLLTFPHRERTKYRSDHWCNGCKNEGTSRKHNSGSENVGVAFVVNCVSISIRISVFGSGRGIFSSWYVCCSCTQKSIGVYDIRISGWPVAFLARINFRGSLTINATETISTLSLGGVINVFFEPIILLWITGICFWCFTSKELNQWFSLQSSIALDSVGSACWALGSILSGGGLEGGSEESDVGNIFHNYLNFRID